MDLAEGQGGNDADHSIHAQCEENSGPGTESRGTEREMQKSAENRNGGPGAQHSINNVVSNLQKRVAEFSQSTKDIKTLAKAVKSISDDMKSLKRKLPSEDQTNTAKQPCMDKHDRQITIPSSPTPGTSTQSDSEESTDDLEEFMQEEEDYLESADTYEDLEDYFQVQDGTGEEVGDQIAKITERALRGTKNKKDEEKLQELQQKHLRPKNIQNLQVPKVDDILWRQLKRETKNVDYLQQKAVANYSQALIPIIKALELLKSSSGKATEATGHIMDAFKILCLNIKATNLGRTERIKRELQPKFRAICKNEASATNLFGDNFQEAVKKLEGTKSNLTSTAQQHFLGKKGGSRFSSQLSHSFKYNYGQNHKNQNKARYNNNHKYQNNYKKKNQQNSRK